ncbi:MAG: DMT family transporter [Anaerovibrio sp.]|nr:DMT family transporter [Anaerovibrio sp.]
MNKTVKGAVCLSLAAIIWGGLFLSVRLVVGAVEAVPLVWLRYILAFFALYILGRCRHVDWHIERKDWKLLALVGLIGQTLSIVTQESGTLLTSAQTGSTITAATPAFMVLFGWWLLKEEMSIGRIMSVILATIGVLMIVYDPDNFQVNLLGGVCLIVAALTWALMAVFLKLLKHYSPIVLTFYGLLVALICLAPYSIWWLAVQADYSLLLAPQVLLSIAYMGIISTTGGFVLWNEGLLYMDASTAGLFMFWQPVVGTFLGWLLLGEPVTLWFWLGFVLIAAGVLLAMNKKH